MCRILLKDQRSESNYVSSQPPRQIRWSNRLRGDRGKVRNATVDGTDCLIEEPTPFSTKWCSHKFNKAGSCYEIAACVQTGDTAFINGPCPVGRFNDIKTFRRKLKALLTSAGEMAEADAGCRGEPDVIKVPRDHMSRSDSRAKRRAGGRHETVNNCLKRHGCLRQKWRHRRNKHTKAFHAIAVITQIGFENGHRPWQVNY